MMCGKKRKRAQGNMPMLTEMSGDGMRNGFLIFCKGAFRKNAESKNDLKGREEYDKLN
jgi:hypothetical protein